ncbi:MAG TPA: NAD/FAD-utilizing enzyme, partial [Anaerolineae bacterium]
MDDLELFEEQLETAGVSTPQIHVLSRNDAEVEHHQHLHEVQSVMKRDLVHSTKRGAILGICSVALVLGIAYFGGLT